MKENSPSNWKKPLTGKRKWLAWFVVFACTVFVATFCIAAGSTERGSTGELMLFALLAAAACSGLVWLLIRFGRWLCRGQNFRRVLAGVARLMFVVACLLTLVALFYAEENWRGKRAWAQFRQPWEAKGERFDLASIVPPPVPDDQNFAMTPLWVETICAIMGAERGRAWYGDKVAALGHTNFVQRIEIRTELYGRGLDAPKRNGNWQESERADLKSWQAYFRQAAAITNFFPVAAQAQTPAEDVLLALSRYDSTIEELRRTSRLPYSRFPIGYADADPAAILLPHLASFRGCATTLQLRALAELQAGQVEKALDDIALMLRLTASIRTEPILISHLVRIATLEPILQTVWEGLSDQRWTDAQLALLESEFSKLDFLADYQFAMRAERAFDAGMMDYLRGARNLNSLSMESGTDERFGFKSWLLVRMGPRGWFDQNKVACCHMNFDLLVPIVNLETRIVSPAAEARAVTACKETRVTPCNWSAGLLLSALTRCSGKFAHAQTATDMARIACALERYRLAQGNFPDALAALTPQWMEKIPHDVLSGQPLKYRRTDNGRFVLYSVGWNQTDDGGKLGSPNKEAASGKIRGEFGLTTTDGDWVWQYPAK